MRVLVDKGRAYMETEIAKDFRGKKYLNVYWYDQDGFKVKIVNGIRIECLPKLIELLSRI